MVDGVGELGESRDKVNIPLESLPDAGDSEEHFKFDASFTAGFQPGVDRLWLNVRGEEKRSSTMPEYLWL
jgi:hypothetical protein